MLAAHRACLVLHAVLYFSTSNAHFWKDLKSGKDKEYAAPFAVVLPTIQEVISYGHHDGGYNEHQNMHHNFGHDTHADGDHKYGFDSGQKYGHNSYGGEKYGHNSYGSDKYGHGSYGNMNNQGWSSQGHGATWNQHEPSYVKGYGYTTHGHNTHGENENHASFGGEMSSHHTPFYIGSHTIGNTGTIGHQSYSSPPPVFNPVFTPVNFPMQPQILTPAQIFSPPEIFAPPAYGMLQNNLFPAMYGMPDYDDYSASNYASGILYTHGARAADPHPKKKFKIFKKFQKHRSDEGTPMMEPQGVIRFADPDPDPKKKKFHKFHRFDEGMPIMMQTDSFGESFRFADPDPDPKKKKFIKFHRSDEDMPIANQFDHSPQSTTFIHASVQHPMDHIHFQSPQVHPIPPQQHFMPEPSPVHKVKEFIFHKGDHGMKVQKIIDFDFNRANQPIQNPGEGPPIPHQFMHPPPMAVAHHINKRSLNPLKNKNSLIKPLDAELKIARYSDEETKFNKNRTARYIPHNFMLNPIPPTLHHPVGFLPPPIMPHHIPQHNPFLAGHILRAKGRMMAAPLQAHAHLAGARARLMAAPLQAHAHLAGARARLMAVPLQAHAHLAGARARLMAVPLQAHAHLAGARARLMAAPLQAHAHLAGARARLMAAPLQAHAHLAGARARLMAVPLQAHAHLAGARARLMAAPLQAHAHLAGARMMSGLYRYRRSIDNGTSTEINQVSSTTPKQNVISSNSSRPSNASPKSSQADAHKVIAPMHVHYNSPPPHATHVHVVSHPPPVFYHGPPIHVPSKHQKFSLRSAVPQQQYPMYHSSPQQIPHQQVYPHLPVHHHGSPVHFNLPSPPHHDPSPPSHVPPQHPSVPIHHQHHQDILQNPWPGHGSHGRSASAMPHKFISTMPAVVHHAAPPIVHFSHPQHVIQHHVPVHYQPVHALPLHHSHWMHAKTAQQTDTATVK